MINHMDTLSSPPPARQQQGRGARYRRWAGSGIAALAIAAIAWFLFTPDPLQVELAQVTQGPMQVTIDNQGQVRVHDKYIVAAPVAAELRRIDLHDGDPVRKGQIVATLSPLPMDARQKQEAYAHLDATRALAQEAALRVQRALTDLQFATNERTRVERLVANGFVSPQAVEKALTAEASSRTEWNAAQSRQQAALADIRTAEAALFAADTRTASGRQLQLSSPVDGYILKVQEKSERTVSAGMPIMVIGDPLRYELVVDVLSTDAVKVPPGATMLVEGWGGGKSLRAKVRLVEPVAFTKVSALGVEEQRVNVIADPVDPLGPLGDGYRIEARIIVWSSDKVVKVAGSSLFRIGDVWHTFVVQDGHAHARAVRIGQRNPDEVQILSGLDPGMLVIRYPTNQLKDGMRVETSDKNRN